jgi:hypothetical protein
MVSFKAMRLKLAAKRLMLEFIETHNNEFLEESINKIVEAAVEQIKEELKKEK